MAAVAQVANVSLYFHTGWYKASRNTRQVFIFYSSLVGTFTVYLENGKHEAHFHNVSNCLLLLGKYVALFHSENEFMCQLVARNV